jgi:porphobilinogen synthase
MFVLPGSGVRRPVSSLPGQFQVSIDEAVADAQRASEAGIRSGSLFGLPESKDEKGTIASCPNGIVQEAVRALKGAVPGMNVITDLCFCEYTSHGHCGVMRDGELQNDETLELLAQQARSHADAGADIIAPSGMLDGMVAAIRAELDRTGHTQVPIMSYSIKYASSFYGPFREAVNSAPSYGDRRGYQMDPANRREAMREAMLDIEEGADILMVKPALAYLDIIRELRDETGLPIAAYSVSGEYAMIKAAALNGWVDGTKVMIETLTALRRAGADVLITYFADEFAECYRSGLLDL